MKLGKKTGITGILLGALGFGGATITDTGENRAQEELAALQLQVQERYEDTIESLETAVSEVGSIVQSGRVITRDIRERVDDTVSEAKERAIGTVAAVQSEAAGVRDDLLEEAQSSLQRLIATAISGLAGIVGTVLAALGFRTGKEGEE